MARFGSSSIKATRFRPTSDDGVGGGKARLQEVRDFGPNPGDLGMKAYVPTGLRPGAPLVVVLHGCTQLVGGFESSAGWTTLADAHGFAVLYPQQRKANNPNLCFSWFQPADVARGQGEVASIREMIETLLTRDKLDRGRVFVTGLSAGGAMASAMLATYPDVFAGGAIVAGLPYGAATSVSEAFSAMYQGRRKEHAEWGDLVRAASPHRGPWPRVVVWHGTADETVVAQNAEESVKQWADVHGVDLGAMRLETTGRRTRRIWGDGAVEANLIAEMGHGVPLDAAAGETPAPYMLDVGVSQARETLAFWGILKKDAAAKPVSRPEVKQAAAPTRLPARTPEPRPRPERGGFAGRIEPQSRPTHARGIDIEGVIKKALRAAGLMK